MLAPGDRSQSVLDDGQRSPSPVVEQSSKPWNVFSDYCPEFKPVSRVSITREIRSIFFFFFFQFSIDWWQITIYDAYQDEFGMSMIHYAASRTHNRNAFFQLLQELDANIGLRDENYRTPRDIAVSSNIRENVKTIDKYMVHIIARGNN